MPAENSESCHSFTTYEERRVLCLFFPDSCTSKPHEGSGLSCLGLAPTPRAPCSGSGGEALWAAELVASIHSTWLATPTQTTRSGWGQALVTEGGDVTWRRMGRCARQRDARHIHRPHLLYSACRRACHDYSAKILRIIYRTKVSTWFLLRCWWSGGGSCQMIELWIGHLGSI